MRLHNFHVSLDETDEATVVSDPEGIDPPMFTFGRLLLQFESRGALERFQAAVAAIPAGGDPQ